MEKVKIYSTFNDLKASQKTIVRKKKAIAKYDVKLFKFYNQFQSAVSKDNQTARK